MMIHGVPTEMVLDATHIRRTKRWQVLALWGEADPWTPLKTGLHSGVSLGQHLDTFELVVLPETGHCPHDESPHECHAGAVHVYTYTYVRTQNFFGGTK